MSNSIWKMPDQKPEDGQHILFFAGGGRLPYLGFYSQTFDIFEDWKAKDIQKWASVLDLIAQADKAERLQKAVDLAVLRLEQGKKKFGKSTMGPNKETAMLCEIVIDEIKQTIEG